MGCERDEEGDEQEEWEWGRGGRISISYYKCVQLERLTMQDLR
jgi:hypothetical protein